MAQIINEYPGIGSILGQGLGTGLGQGLQQIAELKANRLLSRHQQRETAQGLQSLGFSPEEAAQVSLLPKELQGFVLKNYLSAAENAGLMQALGSLGGGEQPPESLQQQATPAPLQRFTAPSKRPLTMQEAAQGIMDPPASRPADVMTQQKPLKKEESKQSLSDLLQRPRLTPEQRLKVESLKQQRDIAQQRLSAREQEEVNKETKPFYDIVQKQAKAAKDANIRLDKMEDLIKKERLTSPIWGAALKTLSNGIFGFGIDLSSLMNADSQEFEKLSNDFIKDAKEFFPGRVTDLDLKAFLKTIPTLSQTRAGKLRIIKNLREFNAIKLAQKEASDKILKQTGGKRPRNFEQLVEELANPQIDTIKKEFANLTVPVDQKYFKELFNG